MLPACANATPIIKDFNENGTITDGNDYDIVNIYAIQTLQERNI
jgi:hypothetical protein